jgi:hypothetical protein
LTRYLLDYNQEWAVKLDLDLTAEAEQASRQFGLQLINGVAGSGKSLIVLYRAHLLCSLFPGRAILVLTHNRALIRDLSGRYDVLDPHAACVQWKTFLMWCCQQWPPREPWYMPIGERRRQAVLREAWMAHLADTTMTETMLGDELAWFKDRPLFSLEDYLTADRTGRGFGLTERMRGTIS